MAKLSNPIESKRLKQPCKTMCDVVQKDEGPRSQFVKTKPLIPLRTAQKVLWHF
jgi:hypothetical protein